MSSKSAFLEFWRTDDVRETFLAHVAREDLVSFRLACHDFGVRAAPMLFDEINIPFRPGTFTKPARLAALNRIGHHVRTLTFTMSHGNDTFLPPLLDSTSGEEIEFIYEPYCRTAGSRLSMPTYGSWEMTDLLVKQYPPLFHAAANVPSFVRAFSAVSNLEHLKISCPGQEPAQRFRRSIVDYALISLRIAIERNAFPLLDSLSLLSIHPGAVQYLNPVMGSGALPSSARRWRQIRNLSIEMDTVPHGPKQPTDHFKLLHAYLETFTASLQRLVFHWTGDKGLFPLTLGSEEALAVSSPAVACPRRCHLALRPLRFSELAFMEVENVTLDAFQVSSFITAHRRSISEFNFEGTTLRSGTWDEALEPLTRISGSEKWKEEAREECDVPIVLSPVGMEGEVRDFMEDYFNFKDGERTVYSRSPVPGAGRERWERRMRKGREKLVEGCEEGVRRLFGSTVLTNWL